MDVEHLATLRELRDRGSVSAVAAARHMSASAVSQQISAIQKKTAVPLTRKEGRRLVLTSAGEELVAAAQGVWDALAQVDDALAHLGAPHNEPVHVSALQSAALAWFPPLVEAGDIDIRCHDYDVPSGDYIALAGDVDIVIAHREARSPKWPAGVVALPLLHEPFGLGVRAGHPLITAVMNHETEQIRQLLAGQKWVSVHADYPLATWADLVAHYVGEPIDIVHRVNDFTVAAALAAHSDAVCVLPLYLHPREPGIELLSIPELHLSRHIDALVRPDKLQRRSVRAVLERIQDLARKTQQLGSRGKSHTSTR